MKIYINSPKESWIVDRFVEEWKIYNPDITTNFISRSDIVWIIAPWTWRSLSKKQLLQKKVVCTIHHFDHDKFDDREFKDLDEYVDVYHIITKKSEKFLREISNKKYFYSPFWIDSKKFFYINDKKDLRKNFGFNQDDYLIGSFQRDTEGSDNKSPKMEKGPDNFVKIVKTLSDEHKNLKVVLTGKRRNYVISELENRNILYKYLPMTNIENLNKLYNTLDLYIVASRVEGGPQSILECALTQTPVISTDVGIANKILNQKSIFNLNDGTLGVPDVSYAYEKVKSLTIPDGFKPFKDQFMKIYGN